MQDRHLNREQYFREQAITSQRYVIPFAEPFITIGPGKRILEIGCGEGGNLKPFVEAGCKVTGVDISRTKIGNAQIFYAGHPQNESTEFICNDIYNLDVPEVPYDFIIMRDVIEHIQNQERFMHFIKDFLASGGYFFLAFPPWQNPFGGHQQICSNRLLAITPWIHLAPLVIYKAILNLAKEPKVRIEGLLEIRQTRLSVERFEEILKHENYKIAKREFFLFNPGYQVKFGIRPRRVVPLFARIPYIRNFYTTAAYYLLQK
jgi:SAM-dependent methyltransferase